MLSLGLRVEEGLVRSAYDEFKGEQSGKELCERIIGTETQQIKQSLCYH